MLTLMTPLKHPDTIGSCQRVVARATSISCPADVLEVTGRRGTAYTRHELLSNAHRLNLLNEVSVRVTLCVSLSSSSKHECSTEDSLSRFTDHEAACHEGRARHRPPRPLSARWILTDTPCDLQRQAEQMLVMRSPWVPGLRLTFKPDLWLSLSVSLLQTENILTEKIPRQSERCDEGERLQTY